MANKRSRKKQQGKQNIQKLTSLGIDKKKADTIKNKPQLVKKEVQKAEKRLRQQKQSNLLASLGYKKSDQKRSWSEKRFNEWYTKEVKRQERNRKQRERRKQKKVASNSGGMKLLILWKDVTDNVGGEFLDDVLQDNQYKVYGDLVEDSKFFMNQTFGEIGQYVNLLIRDDELRSTLHMYPGWTQVYYGNGVQYQKLLTKINFMMLALYQDYTKYLFMTDVIDKMSHINMKTANRLAKDFDIQF